MSKKSSGSGNKQKVGSVNKKINKKQAETKQPTWIVGLIAVAVLVVVLTWWFSRPGTADQEAGLALTVSVQDAAKLREEGAFMLDVREVSEWTAGHIPGATLIPLGELESRLSELPKDEKIVVVCRSGNRSAQGRDILLKAGFESVTSMDGGMNAWAAAGFETVTGP